jgi:hypothetical protein
VRIEPAQLGLAVVAFGFGNEVKNAVGQASSVLGGNGIIVENQYETSP